MKIIFLSSHPKHNVVVCTQEDRLDETIQGCKIIFLLTRPAGLVGGKTYSPLWYYHSPLRINHICIMYYNILMKAIKYSN